MEQWIERRFSTCGVAVVLMQHIPKTDRVMQIYIDCIPFCKHYVYDGEAMFCELGHWSLKEVEKCADKVSSGFTVGYVLEEQRMMGIQPIVEVSNDG
jgi:hypothetical protein